MEQKRIKIEIEEEKKYIKKIHVNTLEDLIDIAWNYKEYDILKYDGIKMWRLIPVLEELNEMIGMEELKNNIVDFVMHYIRGFHKSYDREGKEIETEGDMLHFVLYGDPGTGKTTVANILAKIYSAMGFLSKGHVVKAKITDFIAKYLGQSEHSTMQLLERAKGGVLFIDEAYALSSESEFAISAGNILNAFLSENKKDFVCGIAGYEKDLKEKFFTINPGLERRFNWRFTMGDYNSKDLFNIFKKIVNRNGWNIEKSEKFEKLFNKRKFKYAGGDMETLFMKCKLNYTRRIFLINENQRVLAYGDVEKCMEDIKEIDNNKILTYFL